MTKPFFSIVVPVLNEEGYISKLLLSLEGQEFKNFECIIVDNGSTDKTIEVISELESALSFPIRIKTCKTRGITYARNKGVEKAYGKYIVFLDADGFVDHKYLHKAHDILTINKSLKAISSRIIYFPTSSFWKFIWFNSHLVPFYFIVFISKILLNKTIFSTESTIIEKSAFLEIGKFKHEIMEDVSFSNDFKKHFPKRNQSRICMKLLVQYSPRRFEKNGLLRTLFEWARAIIKRKSSSKYEIYR